jgi:ferredoxin
MKIGIDVDRCAGHGRCYDLAPELLYSDDEGHATWATDGIVTTEHRAQATAAVRNCPERALSLES